MLTAYYLLSEHKIVYFAFKVSLNEWINYIEMFHSCTTDQVKDAISEDMEIKMGMLGYLLQPVLQEWG